MISANKIFFILLLLYMKSAFAISDSCSLYKQQLPQDLNISESSVADYREKLKTECLMTLKYRTLRQELLSQFRIRLQDITEYQAMRFVRRVNFEHSKIKEIPIELTYQTKNEMYALPNNQKSSVIWDNWIRGIMQLNPVKQRVLQGEAFDYELLKRIHVGFFQLSREIGDHAHVPDEGVIKPEVDYDNYWWTFNSTAEAADAKRIVDEINQFYKDLGLLADFEDRRLNRVLDVRTTVKRKPPICSEHSNSPEIVKAQSEAGCDRVHYVEAIFSGPTKSNRKHLENILYFIKSSLNLALANRHIVWNNRLFTPAEAAYLAQKFYIAVHPFSEGNGRTSRFIQELMLTVMDMPHGSSGDIMDYDVLTSFDDYYARAISAQNQLLTKISECKNIYSQLNDLNSAKTEANEIDYSCRLLAPKSTETKEFIQQQINFRFN